MHRFKKLYILDFTNIKYYSEIHMIIKEELDFPDYYGCNLDALWDCLTNMVGRPIHIQIVGWDVIERRFYERAKLFMDIFKEFKHYNGNRYVDQINIEIVRANYIETVE